MAHSRTAASWDWGGITSAAALRGLLARAMRDMRLMVPLCILLIGGSFIAAAVMQMRLGGTHALTLAAGFERARTQDMANAAGAALDHYARAGGAFAETHDTEIARIDPAIRNIMVFDAAGAPLAHLKGTNSPRLPFAASGDQRIVFPGGLVFADGSQIVMVQFDPANLLPHSLLIRGALLGSGGRVLARGTDWKSGETLRAAVPGWPLSAATSIGSGGVLDRWYGSLPSYLLAILGPAVAGAWLAALLVGAFERQGKATRTVRALLAARPEEARLLVRLANAERGAAEARRSKSEFIAHMSHELRTPLNAIIGFSDIIAHGFFGPAGHPKYSEYASDIGEAGRSLHAKIGDILEFANLEAGRHPLRATAVDLVALAEECVAEHQGRAFSRRIGLAIGFCEPGKVKADPAAIKRIFANLISNALAYTGEGGKVRLDVRFEEGAGVASLRDSGMGFSESERRRAGRSFQRFDRAGTVTGAGLGLAIAVELARRMGGAMRLASQPSGGSVMELRLPRAPATAP